MPNATAVDNSAILETHDYDQFTIMEGNRNIDPLHVKRLKKLMTENGNLTSEMPVIVNADNEVIDGQHRLTALKELEWPVYYQVRPNMTLAQVRAINVGNKNWTWYDFAQSYAKLGNQNYQRFVELADEFQYGYGVLARYSGVKGSRESQAGGRIFRDGNMVLTQERYQKARELLNRWVEVEEFIAHPTTKVSQAFYICMESPQYDHKRMMSKMEQFGLQTFHSTWFAGNIQDALRAFEEVYNKFAREGSEARLY